MVNLRTNECLNLPKKWRNRASSISTKKCIILYSEADCQTDRFKATLVKDKVYFNAYSIWPFYLPSFNFHGSRLDFKIFIYLYPTKVVFFELKFLKWNEA